MVKPLQVMCRVEVLMGMANLIWRIIGGLVLILIVHLIKPIYGGIILAIKIT